MITSNVLKTITIFFSILFSATMLYATPVATASDEDIVMKTNVERSFLDSLYIPEDFKAIENITDVIIRAEVLPNRENIELTRNMYGFTRTKVEVTEVYRGDLEVGDIVDIIEEYFYYTDSYTGNIRLRALDLYEPAIIGNEYIFFLYFKGEPGTPREDAYQIVNITDGKFPISKDLLKVQNGDKFSHQALNIGEGDISRYLKIYNEVIKKYLNTKD